MKMTLLSHESKQGEGGVLPHGICFVEMQVFLFIGQRLIRKWKHSRPYTLVLWSHTFDIVALFGAVLVQLRLTSYKNFTTELLEL